MNASQRAAVVAEALAWERTPYHAGARIKGVGVDCALYLLEVFERTGLVAHLDPGHYPRDWHLHRSEEHYMGWLDAYCVRLPRTVQAMPGDIALFKFGRCYSHGAILVTPDTLTHSYIGRGVIQTKYSEEPLHGRDHMHWTLR